MPFEIDADMMASPNSSSITPSGRAVDHHHFVEAVDQGSVGRIGVPAPRIGTSLSIAVSAFAGRTAPAHWPPAVSVSFIWPRSRHDQPSE